MSLPREFVELQRGDVGYVTWLEGSPPARVVDPYRIDGAGALVELLAPAGNFKAGDVVPVRPSQFAVQVPMGS